MVLNQDKGVRAIPEKGFIYVFKDLPEKEKQGDEGVPEENVLEAYAGHVVYGGGAPESLYIAKVTRLSLPGDEMPVTRNGLELYVNQPGHLYTLFTALEEAISAINEAVSDSDKRIDAFFNTASEQKEKSFNLADYLPKTAVNKAEKPESIDLGEKQQA